MKILIVDDMEVNIELLEARLEGSGHEVASARNGVEALERLKTDPIDMIISDILMPKMDGFRLCRACKSDDTLRKIPFVFYTSTYTDKKDEEFALGLGAERFIVKPMENKRFMEIVEGLLKSHKKGLQIPPEMPVKKDEAVYLKEYSERLIKKLDQKVFQLEESERTLQKHMHDLNERIKELHCLYSIVNLVEKPDIPYEEIVQGIVNLIPSGWQYPEITCARVIIEDREFRTDNFKKTTWKQTTDIVLDGKEIGVVEVFYLEERPENYDGPFLKEEAEVLHAIAERFGKIVLRMRAAETEERLQAQLQQAQKMEAIGTLAGGVAHDFNNILTAIIGYADLALMEVGKDGPLREELEEIKGAGERAASLTRQLLAFSRRQTIQLKVIDLNKLIVDMEKMLGRLVGEDIELLTIFKPVLWQVAADPGQMEQVIMNLVVNAKDAMPMGGKLTIETANVYLDENYFRMHGTKEHPGPYGMLSVIDTGAGMDEETISHIFDPFFTTKEVGRGTGLGLSTVYGIVKQSNGFVWAYSEPGQGSTFKVYLPEVKGDAVPEEIQRTPVDDLRGTETVLIVEDDDSLRYLARKVLQQQGYRVLVAENGEDALRISDEHTGSIDLMITDVVMPKMGGKELAEKLQSFYPQMEVIYMSGYTDNAIAHHGVLEPGLNFIEKPFTPEGLARKVREVLDK